MPPDDEKPDDLLLPEDELLALAEITEDDIATAIEWWDAHASPQFTGVLDDEEAG